VDTIDSALERAKKVGADEVINPRKESPVQKIKDLTGGMGLIWQWNLSDLGR